MCRAVGEPSSEGIHSPDRSIFGAAPGTGRSWRPESLGEIVRVDRTNPFAVGLLMLQAASTYRYAVHCATSLLPAADRSPDRGRGWSLYSENGADPVPGSAPPVPTAHSAMAGREAQSLGLFGRRSGVGRSRQQRQQRQRLQQRQQAAFVDSCRRRLSPASGRRRWRRHQRLSARRRQQHRRGGVGGSSGCQQRRPAALSTGSFFFLGVRCQQSAGRQAAAAECDFRVHGRYPGTEAVACGG